MNVIGYTRVSTTEQADSGAGLAAQRAAIEVEAQRRGWTVKWITDAGQSAKSLRRKGIQTALKMLKSHEAEALVVSKLDRLSRSVGDFANLLATAQRQGWAVICLDINIDTSTPSGGLIANLMASVAEWERKIISQRTKDALVAKRNQGVQLGRPPATPPAVVARIVAERAAGRSLSKIAAGLDADGVLTPHGAARWYPNTVNRILKAEARRTARTDVA